jgi:hypothetical protein
LVTKQEEKILQVLSQKQNAYKQLYTLETIISLRSMFESETMTNNIRSLKTCLRFQLPKVQPHLQPTKHQINPKLTLGQKPSLGT